MSSVSADAVWPGPSDYADDLQKQLEQVHGLFAPIPITTDRQGKGAVDNQLRGQLLEQGDAVWLHNPQHEKGLSPKLNHPWEGPYIIVKINDLV